MTKKVGTVFLLLFVGFYIVYGLYVHIPQYDNLKVVGTAGLIQFILSIYLSLQNGQKLISPYVIFLVVMYIFHAGQSLMYPFDIITERDLVGFYGISVGEVFKAQLISFSFLSFFQIGSLLYNTKSGLKIENGLKNNYQNKRIIHVGWFLVIISVYPYYDELIHKAILSMLRGYNALYEEKEKVGLANVQGMLADYFIPALICLFIGYRASKKKRLAIIVILLLNCTIILITGGRTEAVIILALILILQNYLVKSFTKKDLVVIGTAGMMVLVLLAGISKMRSNTSRNIEDTFNLNSEDNNNATIEAISEMGSSMFCQIWTEEIVSKTGDYRLGASYAYSFTSIIPNLGFWEIHPAKEHANLGDWLTEEKGVPFGTGYSMVAEAYINFWYLGAIFMVLLGYLAIAIFGRLNNALALGNIAYVAFILVLFWFSLKIPRNSFIGVVRAIFYFALPIYWYTRGYILKNEN